MPLHFTRENQPHLLEEAAQITGCTGYGADAVAFAAKREKDGPTVATIVFERLANRCADVHFGVAGGKPLSRDIIQGFSTLALHPRLLGLRRVFAYIQADNRKALAACVHFGWQVEGRLRGGGRDGADVVWLSLGSDNLHDLMPQAGAQTQD